MNGTLPVVLNTMAFSSVDGISVVVLGKARPTAEEWGAFLRWVGGVDPTHCLIWTNGGCPTVAQWGALAALIAGHPVPVALLSLRATVRATALRCLGGRVRGFPRTGLRTAAEFLEVPSLRVDAVAQTLDDLRHGLAGTGSRWPQRAMLRGVHVAPGLSPSQRSVAFRVGDRAYSLLVRTQDVEDHMLGVEVLAEHGDEVWILLPHAPVWGSRRIKVPRTSVVLPRGRSSSDG